MPPIKEVPAGIAVFPDHKLLCSNTFCQLVSPKTDWFATRRLAVRSRSSPLQVAQQAPQRPRLAQFFGCASAALGAELRLLEVSIKVPVAQAAAATAGFMAFLAEVGAERDDGHQAKTRWALDHSANHLRQLDDKTE